ncbi:MAG: TonB-dependent receptor [Gemmatimonadetes bacterium]|nr:TonB-dependent receptor [Gemmatimonadota bacterium]
MTRHRPHSPCPGRSHGPSYLLLRLGLAVALGLPNPLAGQANGTVRGVVLDPRMNPIEDALVTLHTTGAAQRTDAKGRFKFDKVAAGAHRVTVRALGLGAIHSDLDVFPGLIRDITFRFPPPVQELDSVVVNAEPHPSARLASFEHRRQTGMGQYFDRGDFEKMMPVSTSQIFRLLPTGLTVRDSAGVPQAISDRGTSIVVDPSTGAPTVRSCQLRLALDGRLLPAGTSLDFVDPREVHGIEVYQGAGSIPVEYLGGQRDIGCGLIIIWTRSGTERDR